MRVEKILHLLTIQWIFEIFFCYLLNVDNPGLFGSCLRLILQSMDCVKCRFIFLFFN